MNRLLILSLVLLSFNACKNKDKSQQEPIDLSLQPIKPNKDLVANIYTSKGLISIGLEYEKCPLTVANFVGLAEGSIANDHKPIGTPFYDGLLFHRVEPQFMIQGGDPLGNSAGNAGYFFEDEINDDLRHSQGGILSMANSGPGTNSCQFFITHIATEWLDGKHTVFGVLISGMDVVNKIAKGDVIDSIRIVRNSDEARLFDAKKVFEAKIEQSKADAINALKERYASYQSMGIYNAFEVYVKKNYPNAIKTPSGMYYIKTSTTDNASPAKGDLIKVHYKGKFTNNVVFDESTGKSPIQFNLGKSMVIPGWDEGLALLNKGEKATFIIPWYLAYGEEGRPGAIGPNETLIFDVHLLDF